MQIYFIFIGLSKDMIKSRMRTNAITMVGTVVAFIFGVICAILLFALYSGFELFEPAAMTFVWIFIHAIISFTQFVTSPELRRFYF